MIAVIKHTLRWRSAPIGVLPLETTFEGLVRVGENYSTLGGVDEVECEGASSETETGTDGEAVENRTAGVVTPT